MTERSQRKIRFNMASSSWNNQLMKKELDFYFFFKIAFAELHITVLYCVILN